MNEILVARNAFALTFTNSAVGRSHSMNGVPPASGPAYTVRIPSGGRAGAADHDAIGVQGVLHGLALPEELGFHLSPP